MLRFDWPYNLLEMAEPAASGSSSPGTDADDVDFDPTADMLVHEYDDERTMDEEEALSNEEDVTEELNDLQKEGDMPLEELLAMYGCGREQPPLRPSATQRTGDASSSSSGAGEDTAAGQEAAVGNGRTGETSNADSEPMQTSRLLRSDDMGGSSSDEDDDEDYDPDNDEYWKKYIQVGPEYQSEVPEGLSPYSTSQAIVYESEDRLLWDPSKVSDDAVEQYNADIQKHNRINREGVYSIPTGAHIRDDEQALYLLLQCNNDVYEALRRHKLQPAPSADPMSLWSEDECRNFENGLRTYGKDFFQIQVNRLRSRSVGELVQFYYLWKKTERHDAFAARTRLEKKRYTMHPGITDYMDRFLDEMDNPLLDVHGSGQSSVDNASVALSRDGGSPLAMPTSSLDKPTTVQSQITSTSEQVCDKVKKPRVSSPSGRSANCKKHCEDGSSACSPVDGNLLAGGEYVESLAARECQVVEGTCSVPKDPDSVLNAKGSGTLLSESEKADTMLTADCSEAQSGGVVTQSVSKSSISYDDPDMLEPSKSDVSSKPCLDSGPVTSSTTSLPVDGSPLAVSITSNNVGIGGELFELNQQKLDADLITAGSCGLPMSEVSNSEVVISSPLKVDYSVEAPTDVASVADELFLPAAVTRSGDGVVLSIESKKIVGCPTLSADLTDIPVETLVPPFDLTGVDAMDVSIDALVPLVDQPDSTKMVADITPDNMKVDFEGHLAGDTFVTFGLQPFASAYSSVDVPMDVPSIAPNVEDSLVKSRVDGSYSEHNNVDELKPMNAPKSGPDGDKMDVTPTNQNVITTSDGAGDILAPSSTSAEFELSVDQNNKVEIKGPLAGDTFVSYNLEPFTPFASSVAVTCSSPNQVNSSNQSATVSSATSIMQSSVVSSANQTMHDCPMNEDVVSEPVESLSSVPLLSEQTDNTSVVDSVASTVDDSPAVGATPPAIPVASEVSATMVVDCPDARPIDDSRKVPLSTSFAPVLSDCHVGSSLMSS